MCVYPSTDYVLVQIAWLGHQRGDAKRGGVLLPVSKFPTFVLQVREMCRDLDAPHISHHLYELAKELFGWVMSAAQSNNKYTDVVKMQNFAYLHKVPFCSLDHSLSHQPSHTHKTQTTTNPPSLPPLDSVRTRRELPREVHPGSASRVRRGRDLLRYLDGAVRIPQVRYSPALLQPSISATPDPG